MCQTQNTKTNIDLTCSHPENQKDCAYLSFLLLQSDHTNWKQHWSRHRLKSWKHGIKKKLTSTNKQCVSSVVGGSISANLGTQKIKSTGGQQLMQLTAKTHDIYFALDWMLPKNWFLASEEKLEQIFTKFSQIFQLLPSHGSSTRSSKAETPASEDNCWTLGKEKNNAIKVLAKGFETEKVHHKWTESTSVGSLFPSN